MAAQPKHARMAGKSRAKPVKPGRLPVSEFAFDRAGAGSPFGDDLIFPVPVERLSYQHPESPEEPRTPPGQPGAPAHAAVPERPVPPEQGKTPDTLVVSGHSGPPAEPPAEPAPAPG